MRTTRTYILRLLVDSDEPDVLHGMVQAVGSDVGEAFADELALAILLRRMASPTQEGIFPTTEDEAAHDERRTGA